MKHRGNSAEARPIKTIHLVAGARPNFMKIAPLYHALSEQSWVAPVIIHTGQHYDPNMSEAFFRDLGLPDPDVNLEVGSGTHAQQTGRVMIAYEELLMENRPDLVVVVGDVNSSIACALAATKLGIAVAHLEAGLRSWDRTMPEEINRVATDSICDLLWTPSPDADDNLRAEGVGADKIVRVGNIMIDSLLRAMPAIESADRVTAAGVTAGEFGIVTLHRPSNVDDREVLSALCGALVEVSESLPLVWPVHPRASARLQDMDLMATLEAAPGIRLLEPLGYVEFMNLVVNSRVVITDSGGLQEETTYLGLPCLTVRPNTERPITVEQGTNVLTTPADLVRDFKAFDGDARDDHQPPELWDGRTAGRVVDSLDAFFFKP